MNNLFDKPEDTVVQGGANTLSITANLTRQTDSIAKRVLTELLNDVEANGQVISESQTDAGKLDDLIWENVDVQEEVDIDALKQATEDVLEKALKSQQSKRSRSKASTMTQDNYIKLLSSAVAEHAIRLALDKPKSSGGRSTGTALEFTDEQLAAYGDDPTALGKAIRNVQSKKSIYKSKADADFSSDYWLGLLAQEQQLKGLRSSTTGVVSKETQQAVEAKEKAEAMLADVDPKSLKADEAKKLLAELKETLAARG